jgi:arsenite methyltransferase
MPLACPAKLNSQYLRSEISILYSKVIEQPEGEYHFHRGPLYAADFLGYDASELALLPEEATRSFAGVGNPLKMGSARRGETVLDIGFGAGTDLLLAAVQTGPSGKAIGVDMTTEMLESARASALKAGLSHVDLRIGDATKLPVEDASVDVVISNGVLNLVPEKDLALREIKRVVKAGGRIQIADIALDVELSEDARADIDLWTG